MRGFMLWDSPQIQALFDKPFFELMAQAHQVYRENFPEQKVQTSSLLSVKTGACPEDCAYCPQSGHHKTGLEKEKLMPLEQVIAQAKQAKKNGATRFCMGAAWRQPPAKEFPKVIEMVKAVKALGLESCLTLGMLTKAQATELKAAGLDYYNHNLDTSPEYYEKIISTRSYDERLQTLAEVSAAGLNTCCGGIMGMGESREDRVAFFLQLSQLPQAPQSIPINRLIPIQGTPLAETQPMDDFEFIRTIAVARIMFPQSYVRLSAGREDMSDTMQAWCYFAGANSIFYGEKLLTAKNPSAHEDLALLSKLGLQVETSVASNEQCC
jgi:biotin synthase